MDEQNDNNLTPKEQYDLKKREKEQEKKKERTKEKINEAPKKIGRVIRNIVIAGVVIGGIGWFLTLAPNLPPTSGQDHSEDIPGAHILTTKMSDRIQRHMIEHADGGTSQGGVPGILIQYNCDDYDCAPDLIQKLTTLAEEYPENVYLAPNFYDGKIILTKGGRREILDEFDEQIIRDFIN